MRGKHESKIFGLDINTYSLPQKERMANNMEEKKKVIAVAKAGAIEIVVEGEKDDYELLLSKRQATKLALDILYTIYKTGGKI
ncbi:MAG: hypothetical protein ACYSR0_02450 [Planctomycetota bacterium]|jgi:hypothetical protein